MKAGSSAKTRADDERELTVMHLLDNEGLTTREAGERLGTGKNSIIGLSHRIRTAYAESCAGDEDPDRHDATMAPLWWRREPRERAA